jgi:hypothetical protein
VKKDHRVAAHLLDDDVDDVPRTHESRLSMSDWAFSL